MKPAPRSASANPDRSAGPSARDARSGQAPAVAGASRPRSPLWATLVATFLGVGHLKPGPGTWGSLATVTLWALASWRIPPESRTWATIAAAIAVTLIGIPASTRVARASGRKDPQFVVIDEVAGQLVALIAVPLGWKTFLAGLILFRVFDILKPPPVRQLERLPEGIGIVVDDLAAGLYALVVMHLLLHFRLLTG
ncbi:MAG: phosphatidylglycerophosphatase A [Terriglobales bacterium]